MSGLIYGVGVYEAGKYPCKTNGDRSKVYASWFRMLERCYSEKYHKRQPTYIGCSVCEEWHNFQIFGQWFEENYYELNDERVALDKDLIIKGNKIYSPETCVFVPQKINNFILKCDSARGVLPIGVKKDHRKYRDKNPYQTSTSFDSHRVYLGSFSDIMEAFYTYKQVKEMQAKTILLPYENKIPKNIFQRIQDALEKYVVEIND